MTESDPSSEAVRVRRTPGARVWGVLRRFGPLLLLLAALIAAWASGLTRDISLHALREKHEALQAAVRAHPAESLAGYVAAYTALVAVSAPVALVMTLTGGLLFGAWVGGTAAAVSCTVGSTIIFLVCRTALGDVLRRRAGPTVARIEAGVRRDAFSYIVTLRLIPVMPFWLANLALGFVDIPLSVYAGATFIGILPVSLVYAGVGANLNLLFARHQRPDLHLVLRPQVLLPLIGLALLALAPILVRRFRRSGAQDDAS